MAKNIRENKRPLPKVRLEEDGNADIRCRTIKSRMADYVWREISKHQYLWNAVNILEKGRIIKRLTPEKITAYARV